MAERVTGVGDLRSIASATSGDLRRARELRRASSRLPTELRLLDYCASNQSSRMICVIIGARSNAVRSGNSRLIHG